MLGRERKSVVCCHSITWCNCDVIISQVITAGTEQFNKSPSAGLVFLQEQGVLQSPLNPVQVASFLRQNPALNKQLLGDFLGARNNAAVLEAFVKLCGRGIVFT